MLCMILNEIMFLSTCQWFWLICIIIYCLIIQVVHPAPGNTSGTLVNGILHHCSLPMLSLASEEVHSEAEDASDDEFIAFPRALKDNGGASSGKSEASIRPGIVHRLDKGTSGLLVVAKVIPAKSVKKH